jgi:hypothetical protein
MKSSAYIRHTTAAIETYSLQRKTTTTRILAITPLQYRKATPTYNMCQYQMIDEHDRLTTTVELLHAASMNNEPVDIYRLHNYFVTTDEREDDVADANEEVGAAFGYGPVGSGEVEDEAMPDDVAAWWVSK